MGLKSGYTTGTCAAIAARAAAVMIFEQREVKRESALTPKGVEIEAEILKPVFDVCSASCAVKKYAGDDPDITNGMLLFANITLKNTGEIMLDGGEGIGRVTKAGLSIDVGQAAINPVPRQMIIQNVAEVFEYYGYEGGADIVISAPGGEEIAKKTFNPRLGIEGGISILGTSGIVEPMSERAIIDTIKAELKVKRANEGDYVLIAPGNYGIDFIRDNFNVNLDRAVKCSNYVGEALDTVCECGFKGVLLIGHIGKFVKLAGGIMNTHSKTADCRMEIMAANTAMVSDNTALVRQIMGCLTTDDALGILKEHSLCNEVMKKITDKATVCINNRVHNNIETGIIIFSNVYGLLGASDNAYKLLEYFKVGDKA